MPAMRKRRHRPQLPRLLDEYFRPLIQILTLRRMLMGLTQEEVNHMIGAADGHLAKWEAHMFLPSSYFLVLWCEALGYRLKLAEIEIGERAEPL